MPNLQINPVVPVSAMPQQMVSSKKYIKDRRLVEIQPQSQVSYTYTGNNVIRFDINSPSDFIDFQKSYVRLQLTCVLNNSGSDDTTKYLSEGGAHCLFRTLEISTQTGTTIQRIERYNKLYAIMSQVRHAPQYIDSVLHREGDSWNVRDEVVRAQGYEDLAYSQTEANYDHTLGAAEQILILATTAGAADVSGQIRVGDMIRIETAVLNFTARVLTLVSALAITVEGLPAVDIAANAILSLKIWRDNGDFAMVPTRKRVANNAGSVLCFQPWAPFFEMGDWFPLFLVRGGISVQFSLERDALSLVSGAAPRGSAGFAAASYTITNPVYCADMITPMESLSQSYIDMFNQQGLSFAFTGYRHFMDIQSGGGSGIYGSNINSNVRSATHILTKLQNLRAETTTTGTVNAGKSTYTCDSVAQGLKAQLSRYHYESGSSRFPLASPTDLTNYTNAEAMIELERAMRHTKAPIAMRHSYADWIASSVPLRPLEDTYASDSKRLVLSADLTLDSAPWAGLDLSLAPLRAELDFGAGYQITDLDGTSNAVPADRYIHHFLGFTQVMLLSSKGIILYN